MAVPVTTEHLAAPPDASYRQIFEATTDGLLVNDPETGRVVEVNPAFCRMHGYAYDELIGRDPTDFIHPEDHGKFEAFLASFRAGGGFHTHARDVRKDGSVFEVEVRAATFEFRGRPHLLGVVRDISAAASAARELEAQVEQRTRELRSVVDLARQVSSSEDLGTLISSTVAHAKSLIESDGLALYLRHGDTYALEHCDGAPPAATIRRAELSAVLDEIEAGRSIEVYEYEPGAAFEQTLAVGIRPIDASVIVVPMMACRDAIGFLAVHKVCNDHEKAPRVMELAQAFASQIAITLTNRRLAETARAAAAVDERNRIARDLHDAVSQTLFSTTMHARAAEMALDRSSLPADDPARQHVGDLAALTLGALAEMRALIFELRPGALAEAGLAVAIRRHAGALHARHQLTIEVTAPEDRLPLSGDVEEALYRIAQEALGNVIKHARASRAEVELWRSESSVSMRIVDNGAGFDAGIERPGHLGLHTMVERAERAGGTLEVTSREGCGTTILARVPIGGAA